MINYNSNASLVGFDPFANSFAVLAIHTKKAFITTELSVNHYYYPLINSTRITPKLNRNGTQTHDPQM